MSDYDRIATAIHYINTHVDQQPTLQDIAAHLHLSPYHFQRMFTRWAGLTPKRYLQSRTVEQAKALLLAAKPLLEVSNSLGLSSSSRLYDHFIQLEAVTPGEYKKSGTGLQIDYAIHPSPFGNLFIALTPRGICDLVFLDDTDIQVPLATLYQRWPNAKLREDRSTTAALVSAMFGDTDKLDRPLSLYVSGTNFQISVWKALLKIPPGSLASYSQVAHAIGKPRAARAVGTANGRNPIAFLIPCHRVIQHSGRIGDYHWGETRKRALHAWETIRRIK